MISKCNTSSDTSTKDVKMKYNLLHSFLLSLRNQNSFLYYDTLCFITHIYFMGLRASSRFIWSRIRNRITECRCHLCISRQADSNCLMPKAAIIVMLQSIHGAIFDLFCLPESNRYHWLVIYTNSKKYIYYPRYN